MTRRPSSPPAAPYASTAMTLDDDELILYQSLFYQRIGLHLTREKKALLISRLTRRLTDLGVSSFREYHQRITAPGPIAAAELQYAIDLITTNETRFFRNPEHFGFLRETILPQRQQAHPFRVWSAACSSGEEAYSLAMVLNDVLGTAPWQVLGSDVSQRMLHKARRALYPMERCQLIPHEYLKRHCLRGQHEYAGQLLMDHALREQVTFVQLNLTDLPETLGPFDLIFLRNVLIYFDLPTKTKVVKTVLRSLRPGGHLVLGLAESLQGLATSLENVSPAIYRKSGADGAAARRH